MKRIIFVFALFGLLLPLGVPIAEAMPLTLSIDAGPILGTWTNTISVEDNDGADMNDELGQLLWIGMVGGFDFSVTYGTDTLPGGLAKLSLDSTNTHTAEGAPGALRVRLSSSYANSTVGAATASGLATGDLTAAAGSTITIQSYVNGAEVYDGTPSNTDGPGGFEFADSTSVNLGNADFTLMTQILVNFAFCNGCENSMSVSVADVGVEAVPEPASMFLLGSGLLGLATVVRNRAKKRSA